MEWTADVSTGDWIRQRLDDPWRGTMHDVVPRGFDSYVRIFHPVVRERPVGRAWPAEGDTDAWEALLSEDPEVDTEHVTWAATAAAFGTRMHPLAQWFRLVRSPDPYGGSGGSARDDDGWRYDGPDEGDCDPATLAEASRLLALHTTTPGDGGIAVWEGWGGLLGAMSETPSRSFFGMTDGLPVRYSDDTSNARYASISDAERHAAVLGRSWKDVFNNPFRKKRWQPGNLPDDVSRGPRLELPNRGHVLFRGGVTDLADPQWALHAPWRDRIAEARGFPVTAHSPSLVWPADHAWVLITEVDFDSTVIGGTRALTEAILADDALEAHAIDEGSDLSWDGDTRNR